MSLLIKTTIGDTGDIRVKFDTTRRLDDVTALDMLVYDDENKTTLLGTLTGSVKGFDAAIAFAMPASFTDAAFTRYFTFRFTRTSDIETLPDMGKWKNE